jgi:hypothetical protein
MLLGGNNMKGEGEKDTGRTNGKSKFKRVTNV